MALDIRSILYNLPEVRKPQEKKLSFNVKLKWTLIVLAAFFIMANIPLYGLSSNFFARFGNLAVILGTEFGSLIHLGIGPIVMSSIILQLLAGSGIFQIDTKTPEGKRYFQGLQKLGVLFFIVFEAFIFVFTGALSPIPGFTSILIFQLILGGLLIMFMDEIIQKWGFGSGVSLFIVAGVSWQLFTGLFQFIGPGGGNCLLDFTGTPCTGRFLIVLQSIITGVGSEFWVAIAAILATALIFLAVVWAQNLKVEIPLTYERLRGYGVKWPLAFFYSSVIPVILVAALVANIQLFAGILQNWLGHPTFLGGFPPTGGTPISGLAFWVSASNINIVESIIRGSFQFIQLFQAFTYLLFFMIFSAIFAVFWVKTSGMDEQSQAKNIMSSGLQIPGFRKDPRVLESILRRYIMPLTVMGGLAIGALAALADSIGAITSGTAILLAVMIVYQLYQSIAQQHAVDMHPAMRKFMGN
jgi:preprotein translocase subunit SecY